MENGFLHIIKQQTEDEQKILIAVSGGVDSMVLLDLFIKHCDNQNLGIAHCNFQLREGDSVLDQELVKNAAKKHNIPFYCENFETEKDAKDRGVSIEMMAREQRYLFFDKLCKENGFSHIAVAHHREDSTETFFINLLRGTGLKGLRGIPEQNGKIIRPLLSFSKTDILAYAKRQNIIYREDKTNGESIYFRNKIRNQLLPLLREINPQVDDIMAHNISVLKEEYKLFQEQISAIEKTICSTANNQLHISISGLMNTKFPVNYLYQILAPYNFHYSIVEKMVDGVNRQSGQMFSSPTHKVVKDRQYFIVSSKKNDTEEYFIEQGTTHISMPIELEIKEQIADQQFSKSKNEAHLDSSLLQFPLTLRRWKEGDSFCPLGMYGKKKLLSDFFIDNKFSVIEKENTWLLCSGDDIIWVVGHRIDDRYKVTEKTERKLIICKKC